MKKERRIISVLLILVLLLSLIPGNRAFADTVSYTVELTIGSKTVYINGSPKEMDVAPFIDPKTNRTLVPVRFVAEGLGGKVSWQNREKFVGVLVGNRKVGMWIGKSTAEVTSRPASYEDGYDVIVKKEMDQPPVIANGRTMIPLRFVSESVGADVQWDGSAKKITITLSYEPLKMLDMVWALSFDRYITKTGTTTAKNQMGQQVTINTYSGLVIPTPSPMTYDTKNKAIYTIGYDLIYKFVQWVGGDDVYYKHFPNWYGPIYLVKIDALTGIIVSYTKILDGLRDWVDSHQYGIRRSMYLAYNNGYIYVGGLSSEYQQQANKEPYVPGRSSVYITLRKLDSETYKVIWSKRYNLQETLFGKDLYLDNTTGLEIGIKDLSPLFFSADGKNFMIPVYIRILSSCTYKGIKEDDSYLDFATYLGFDAQTGSIVWKQVHDAFENWIVDSYQIPIVNDIALIREDPGMLFVCWDKKNPGDSYYSYQSDLLWNLTQKLIKENVTDKGLKLSSYRMRKEKEYDNVGIEGVMPYPIKLMGINIKTGKTVWEKTFLNIVQEPGIPHGVEDSLSQVFVKDGIAYIPANVYDPQNNYKFGTQFLRVRITTGEVLPLYHTVIEYPASLYKEPVPFADMGFAWSALNSYQFYETNGQVYVTGEGSQGYCFVSNGYYVQIALIDNSNFIGAEPIEEFINNSGKIETYNRPPGVAYILMNHGSVGIKKSLTVEGFGEANRVSGARYTDICTVNMNDIDFNRALYELHEELGFVLVRYQDANNSGFIAINIQ